MKTVLSGKRKSNLPGLTKFRGVITKYRNQVMDL